MGWLEAIIKDGLIWFYDWTNSYGMAIILLTIVVRIVILPLTLYQTRAMKKLQLIQPEMKKLQEKYKGEPEKLNKEMMELYRTHKVNPLSGCLPVLVQLPFLIAIFNVLRTLRESFGDQDFTFSVLGLTWDLTLPDAYYILPVLTVVTMFWQSKISMTGTDATQRMMIYAMPLLMGWFTIKFPAGLVLYWVVSTLFGVVQHYAIPSAKPAPQPEKKPEQAAGEGKSKSRKAKKG